MKYCGIVENNEWEGEYFGYYLEQTEEAKELIAEIERKYKDGVFGEYSSYEYEFEYDVDETELQAVSKFDKNDYMPRVNYTDIDSMIMLNTRGACLPYKGSITLTNEENYDII